MLYNVFLLLTMGQLDLDNARAAILFLKVFDFLIARNTLHYTDEDEPNKDESTDNQIITRIVRARLQQLEMGKWLNLIDDALEDIDKARARAIVRRLFAAAENPDENSSYKYQCCIEKIMHGDTRTGHRILRPSGLHSPSDETAELMKAKFNADSSSNNLQQHPEFIRKAKRCKSTVITQQLVSKVVQNNSDCKTSGASGCRNSRLKLLAMQHDGRLALTHWSQR